MLVEAVATQERDEVAATFGGVHALHARLAAGEPADVIVLTRSLVDALIGEGHVQPGSRADLGPVATGVAARAADALPSVATPAQLRRALLQAPRIYCPDPRAASAGVVLVRTLRRLGILSPVRSRLVFCPSGGDTARRLAASRVRGTLAILQASEVPARSRLAYAGALPRSLAAPTVYSAGLSMNVADDGRAAGFVRRLRARGFGRR